MSTAGQMDQAKVASLTTTSGSQAVLRGCEGGGVVGDLCGEQAGESFGCRFKIPACAVDTCPCHIDLEVTKLAGNNGSRGGCESARSITDPTRRVARADGRTVEVVRVGQALACRAPLARVVPCNADNLSHVDSD